MQVSLKRVGGAVKIDIDGTAYEPLSFKSFRPTARNISDFYKAGVRLFSILSSGLNSILGVPYSLYGESWIGYDSYDFTPIDRQIELFLQNAPQGYFALMLQLDTRDWYIKKENCPNSFTNLSQIAGDSKWRAQAANYLKAVLNHVEEKYGDRFYGYFLLGGTTTEWFSNRDYFAPHPMKERDYRRFTGCPEAVLPQQAEICRPKETVFYAPDADRNVIDAVRYHCQIIADAILYFASEAQQVLKHRKLVGVYYGYLFELAGARLWNDGSLDYMRVFNSPDIDMISSPSSYAFRKHIDPSAFMVTYDSLNRCDKLYYLEFDHITHLAPQYIEGHGIPGYDSKLKNEQETIDIMRRDFCLTLAKGAALWWFDMFEGWFYSEGMMNEIACMIRISEKLSVLPAENVSEIAVFAEGGESLYHVNKESALNTPLLSAQRGGLAYLGAPYDVFDISDLDRIDTAKYKLFIFLDAFCITAEQRAVIEEKYKTGGKTLLWCYAPGYIGENGMSADNISALTGIHVLPYTGTGTKAVAFGKTYGFDRRYETMFCAADGEPLGRYETDSACALARKNCGDFTGVYSALGNLPGAVLREIAKAAGVFLYSESDDPVYVNSLCVGVCAHNDGTVSLNLPDSGELTELFSGQKARAENGKLSFSMRAGEVKLFLRSYKQDGSES